MDVLVSGFDYDAAEHFKYHNVLINARDAIRDEVGNCARSIVEIGHQLIGVRGECGRGLYLKWIAGEFGWSYRTAYNFKSVAERFGHQEDLKRISNLEPTTLYLLAAKSTPETVREEVLRRLDTGEKISAKEIRAMIREANGQQEKREKMKKSIEMERKPRIISVHEALSRLSSEERWYVKDVVIPAYMNGE